MNRRSFLKVLGGTAAATAIRGTMGTAVEAPEKPSPSELEPLPKRNLGKTGEKLSIIGFGGLALNQVEQSVCNDSVSMSIDRGVNYFDVAPEYGDAEQRMGIALQRKRDRVFLSCKTAKRDKSGAEGELERSLTRLKTDHLDLYQLHHIRSKDETEQALGPGGAIEAFVEARKKGLVRFLGFSAHTTKAALLAMETFPFDTIMFPVNFMEWLKIGFGPDVVENAREKGMGVIAIKPMFGGLWPPGAKRPPGKWQFGWYQPVSEPVEVDLALRFTLSQPVSTAIPPSDVRLIRLAIDVAPRTARPLSDAEREKLRELAKPLVSYFEGEEKRFAFYRECGEVWMPA